MRYHANSFHKIKPRVHFNNKVPYLYRRRQQYVLCSSYFIHSSYCWPSRPSSYCHRWAVRPRFKSPAWSFFRPLCSGLFYARWLSRSSRNEICASFCLRWPRSGRRLGRSRKYPCRRRVRAGNSPGLCRSGCAWIGVPFLMLGATSPLMQVWWSRLRSTRSLIAFLRSRIFHHCWRWDFTPA